MYNLRENCAIYNIDPERIQAIVDSDSEKPFIPVRQLDVLGQTETKIFEEEVILMQDF